MNNESGTFFAWVKVIRDEDDAPLWPRCDGLPPLTEEEELKLLSGDRPPSVVVTDNKLNSAAEGQYSEDCDVYEYCDAHHRRLWADPACWGEWKVDSVFSGQHGESFEAMHFIGERAEAIKWLLDTPEGQQWRRNARQVALMRFTAPTKDMCEDDQEAAIPSLSYPPYARGHKWKHSQPFPRESWRSDFKFILKAGFNPRVTEADTPNASVFSPLLDDLDDLVTDQSGATKECQAVSDAVDQHQAERYREIRAQASDIAALKAVAIPAGQLLDKPATLRLLDLVRQHMRLPIFALKWHYGRGRPWDYCGDNLPLAIQPGEPLFPAHAAFPAGHATLAYTLAELLSHAFPHGPDFFARAARVSQNRVIAGLHWPSDIEAGRVIAKHFAPVLLAQPTFKNLLKDVRKEWP